MRTLPGAGRESFPACGKGAPVMGQDLKKIEKAYDALAEEWAREFAGEHEKKPMDRKILQRFAQEVGKREPVWDFGCGPGNTTEFLKNLGINVSGLDLSEKLLERARTDHPGIRFQKGDMLGLEFGNESIAGVVAFYAIVHFTREQVVMAFGEVFRVLQPHGVFLLAFHIGDETIHIDEFLGRRIEIDFMFFDTDFITGCLEGAGFEGIEAIEREPYAGVEYESRRAYVFARKPGAKQSP